MRTKNSSGQLTRLAFAIKEHDFEIQNKPGKKHGNADRLSRSRNAMQNNITIYELPEKLQ